MEVNAVDRQEENLYTPDIMEHLIGISSRLQATEFYIQPKEKSDAEVTACSVKGELHRSHQHGPATHASPMTSPLLYVPEVAAELLEEVRERVAMKIHKASILTISTSKHESDMDAEIREPPRKRCPLKSGKVGTADSMVAKKVIWPCGLVYIQPWASLP